MRGSKTAQPMALNSNEVQFDHASLFHLKAAAFFRPLILSTWQNDPVKHGQPISLNCFNL